jgi:uncharacterized RDD family membrane protein YckC
MSDQNSTSPDPSEAVPGYTPPSYDPPAPSGGYAEPPAAAPSDPYAAPGAYPPPPAPGYPGGFTPPPVTGFGGQLAEWPIRALGGLIDYVAPSIVFGLLGGILNGVNSNLGGAAQGLLGIAWWIYLAYLSGTYGITPGRAVAKTKLISEATGDVIGFGPAFIRQLAHIIDSIICYIGWLFPLWDAKKQTIADKIAKTVVVDNSADPTAGQIRWS